MIVSYCTKITEELATTGVSRKFPSHLQPRMLRALFMLNEARVLDDLRSPPGNRLELLRGNRLGQHSIRINTKWRICFIWHDGDVHNVEIVDYHT